MLRKENRLTKNREFKQVMSQGLRLADGLMAWFFLPGSNQTKIGIVISSKVAPRAHKRNQIKRWLRGFWQKGLNQLPVGRLVVLVRKPPSDQKEIESASLSLIEELKRELEK